MDATIDFDISHVQNSTGNPYLWKLCYAEWTKYLPVTNLN